MASLQDLLAQKQQLEQQIALMQSQARSDAIGKVMALMAEHGLTAADVVGRLEKPAKSAAAGKKVAAKYRDPVSGATWTGRGLKPKWLTAALEAGKSLSDFAI